MRVDNARYDGQTQPDPSVGPGSPFVDAVEALEEVGKVLRRDAGTGVFDRQDGVRTIARDCDGDAAARSRMTDGVLHQIDQHLAEPEGINPGFDTRTVLHAQVTIGGEGLQPLD